MEFDKNNKNFFSNFDKDKNNKSDKDFDFEDDIGEDFDFGDSNKDDIDFEFGDDFDGEDFNFGDEPKEQSNDSDFGFGEPDEKQSDDFNFGDDSDFDFDDKTDKPKKERPKGESKGKEMFNKSDGFLDRIIVGFGIREGGIFHKLIKYGIYLAIVLFIVFFIIGYLIIGTIFGGNDDDEMEGVDYNESVQESDDKSFFENINSSVAGLFGGDSEDNGIDGEGINSVTIDASYEEDYLELAQQNVFRYRQPAVINGMTFKLFNVEPYENLTNAEEGAEYIRMDFGIKNESSQDLKFTEYDFKLYTKDALESKDTEDEGYIGINEESNSINVNIDEVSESVKGLFVSQGIEPTVIRRGDNTTSLGKGVLKPDEVYSAFIVFEVLPDVENEYILGFYPTGYPFEILMKTYE